MFALRFARLVPSPYLVSFFGFAVRPLKPRVFELQAVALHLNQRVVFALSYVCVFRFARLLLTCFLFSGSFLLRFFFFFFVVSQALKCGTNHCPTGVATQDPDLMKGLVVSNKTLRVQRFQEKTVHAAAEIISAAGVSNPAGEPKNQIIFIFTPIVFF